MTDDAVLSDGVLVDDADVTAGDNEVADTGEENAEDTGAEEVAVPAEDAPIEDDPWTRREVGMSCIPSRATKRRSPQTFMPVSSQWIWSTRSTKSSFQWKTSSSSRTAKSRPFSARCSLDTFSSVVRWTTSRGTAFVTLLVSPVSSDKAIVGSGPRHSVDVRFVRSSLQSPTAQKQRLVRSQNSITKLGKRFASRKAHSQILRAKSPRSMPITSNSRCSSTFWTRDPRRNGLQSGVEALSVGSRLQHDR